MFSTQDWRRTPVFSSVVIEGEIVVKDDYVSVYMLIICCCISKIKISNKVQSRFEIVLNSACRGQKRTLFKRADDGEKH